MTSVMQRFTAKFIVTPTGCHEWTAALTNGGYGRFQYQGKAVLAHRMAWFLEHGEWPPVGTVTDHLCRNRRCVNVSHMEAVTPAENIRRGETGKNKRPDLTKCGKGLHDWIPENIYSHKGAHRCRPCNTDYQFALRAG